MDRAALVVNLGIFVASALAAVVAWVGVNRAKQASDEAAEHEAKALEYSKKSAEAASASADAQDRAAKALEEANRREAERDAKITPWLVKKVKGDRWRVTNNTGGIATDVEFIAVGDENIQMEDDEDLRDVPADQPVFIYFGGGTADPPTATLRVEWNDYNERAQDTTIVLG